eukprot:s4386_g8.t1
MDVQANLLGRTPHRGHATRPTPVPAAARSPVPRNGCRPTQMLIRNRVTNGTGLGVTLPGLCPLQLMLEFLAHRLKRPLGGSIHVQRRSMEARISEGIAEAAVTPQKSMIADQFADLEIHFNALNLATDRQTPVVRSDRKELAVSAQQWGRSAI